MAPELSGSTWSKTIKVAVFDEPLGIMPKLVEPLFVELLNKSRLVYVAFVKSAVKRPPVEVPTKFFAVRVPASVIEPRFVILNPPKSWLARIGVCPSFATEAVKAVAISVSVLFAQVDEIVVPVTTGLPAGRE